ncbi:hypothetical protein CDAR_511531 [Caerostris darwini]|uniref:Secreted protein n=1 Tax=Caerostris darwini TaxID=1538125 RepID=A0AAV4TPX4_9ARAC|nr:hypothetical protein CDAR_511531 [Caerostris darwini]
MAALLRSLVILCLCVLCIDGRVIKRSTEIPPVLHRRLVVGRCTRCKPGRWSSTLKARARAPVELSAGRTPMTSPSPPWCTGAKKRANRAGSGPTDPPAWRRYLLLILYIPLIAKVLHPSDSPLSCRGKVVLNSKFET